MDEPLSNLDAQLREQMRLEIRALQQRLGITTIYVTHDQEEAMVLSDEVAVMHEGRVLQTAPPETLYARPANRTVAAFFGAPNLLLAKAREVRRGAETSLVLVEGDAWEGWCLGSRTLQPGEVVTVVIRPEVVRIGRAVAARPEAGIVWRGVVRQRFFRGTRNLYTVDAAGIRLTVDAPPDHPLAPGAEVALDVDAAHTWVVRD
jgi:ABC-type sugar transport system ATPase subunit